MVPPRNDQKGESADVCSHSLHEGKVAREKNVQCLLAIFLQSLGESSGRMEASLSSRAWCHQECCSEWCWLAQWQLVSCASKPATVKLLSTVTEQHKLYLECKTHFPLIPACFGLGFTSWWSRCFFQGLRFLWLLRCVSEALREAEPHSRDVGLNPSNTLHCAWVLLPSYWAIWHQRCPAGLVTPWDMKWVSAKEQPGLPLIEMCNWLGEEAKTAVKARF